MHLNHAIPFFYSCECSRELSSYFCYYFPCKAPELVSSSSQAPLMQNGSSSKFLRFEIYAMYSALHTSHGNFKLRSKMV